jgi:hypothetical protein
MWKFYGKFADEGDNSDNNPSIYIVERGNMFFFISLSVRHSDLLPREWTFHFRLFSLEICIFPQHMYNKS